MDPNLELYRSLLHLPPYQRRERMPDLPYEELRRIREIIGKENLAKEREENARRREEDAKRRKEFIAGRDLAEVTLTDPSRVMEDKELLYPLLGRTLNSHNEDLMIKRITNDNARCGSTLVDYIHGFDKHAHTLCLDAWKLVYCDIYYVDGGSATLQEIYEARVQEEELQTPAARARELVRDDRLKKARRNAKWMIPALECLSADELVQPPPESAENFRKILEYVVEDKEKESTRRNWEALWWYGNMGNIWKQVSPASPAWMQKILDNQHQWGFIYYLARDVDKKYLCHWKTIWDSLESMCSPMRVTWSTIHCQGSDNRTALKKLLTQNRPIFYPNENLTEDEDLRKHFKEYIEVNRSQTLEDEKRKKNTKLNKNRKESDDFLSPGLLRNTFIVVPGEFLSANIHHEGRDRPDPCYVWAYDADWDSSEETVFNGEKYQGRVRVAIGSVNSWFYGARWEGISLHDMWLKAQQHPKKVWECYTKEFEEWDHEPYI